MTVCQPKSSSPPHSTGAHGRPHPGAETIPKEVAPMEVERKSQPFAHSERHYYRFIPRHVSGFEGFPSLASSATGAATGPYPKARAK
ncbi:hypothetical protein An16g01180 [Aspergillus niger]|uniref:Uncharacterized protein n=2 Tax=Aspergillus niger TaxID=5061 RepID=A2R6T9_ASPNC|nr:hypothetical protein An16g01180 [Aspergillus niger]CAK42735.1 hypothetical protein An16g01180 [Aspergillus niger]